MYTLIKIRLVVSKIRAHFPRPYLTGQIKIPEAKPELSIPKCRPASPEFGIADSGR
jgi:hypothetical protein